MRLTFILAFLQRWTMTFATSVALVGSSIVIGSVTSSDAIELAEPDAGVRVRMLSAKSRPGSEDLVTPDRVAADAAMRATQARPAANVEVPPETWEKLAKCESNKRWDADTGNGYYGGLQFALTSWRAVGGNGYPHEAPKHVQIGFAERLLERQGWGAWPSCSRRLGLF